MLEASMSREKTAFTVTVCEMALAPPSGFVETTVGAPVVKLHVTGCVIATPAVDFTAVVTCAVYVVWFRSGALGVSVAIWLPSNATLAATSDPFGARRVKLALEI